jgi:hypothetical protein
MTHSIAAIFAGRSATVFVLNYLGQNGNSVANRDLISLPNSNATRRRRAGSKVRGLQEWDASTGMAADSPASETGVVTVR